MTIPLTGPESLFVRLGHIFATFDLVNTQRGTDLPPHIDTIQADFDTTNQDIIDNIYTNLLTQQNSASSLPSSLRSISEKLVTEMVNDDLPQSSLSSLSVCMQALIDQMNDNSESVQACHASASVTPSPSNNGNANVIIGLLGANGLLQENTFKELIIGTVDADSQTGGARSGSERITFIGQYPINDALSWLYPVGSGGSVGLACINASLSQQRGVQNHLNNSDFELWTVPNIPNAWNILVGTAGTSIKQSTTEKYDGSSSLEFVGDGTEETTIYQQFAISTSSGDTSAILTPITQYAFNAWIKTDNVPAQGELTISLSDSSGNILSDVQGNQAKTVIDLTTIGTEFTPVYTFIRTPRIIPAQTRFTIALTTPLPSGTSLFIDRLAMAQPTVMYQGGPSIAAFSGASALIRGDSFSIDVHNDYAGKFQRTFERFFNMRQLNLLLPSSDSPTISDDLIE